MLSELEHDIKITDEVLNGLPVTNLKTQQHFIKEIDKEISNYQLKASEIEKELKRRIDKYEKFKHEEDINNNQTLAKLQKALLYTNTLSTPYEKLGFDKIVYQLSHYQEGDLINNNRNILKAINIYKAANIALTPEDFNYTKFVNNYMPMFFGKVLTVQDIKKTFDDIYWQCPNIMTQIELNLRYIYNKNIKKVQAYIDGVNKQISERFKNSSNSLLDDYNYLRKKDENYFSGNNLIVDFYSQSKDIDDYTDEKVDPIISSIFGENSFDESKINLVNQLKNSLIEYKNYLKYKDLIDKIKEIYAEQLEKDFMKKQNKKISDLEKKLFKLNKKFSNKFSSTSVDKLEPQINGLINEIKAVYNEIDANMFKIIVKEHIQDNSTIFKSLLLVYQYYAVLADYFKEKNPEITYEQIDTEIQDFYNFIMDPDNTMINNIMVLEEKEISDIISTNYKMLNISIGESLADEDSIDTLLNNLEKIIINHNLKNLDISISDLQEAKEIKTVLSKNNAI